MPGQNDWVWPIFVLPTLQDRCRNKLFIELLCYGHPPFGALFFYHFPYGEKSAILEKNRFQEVEYALSADYETGNA